MSEEHHAVDTSVVGIVRHFLAIAAIVITGYLVEALKGRIFNEHVPAPVAISVNVLEWGFVIGVIREAIEITKSTLQEGKALLRMTFGDGWNLLRSSALWKGALGAFGSSAGTGIMAGCVIAVDVLIFLAFEHMPNWLSVLVFLSGLGLMLLFVATAIRLGESPWRGASDSVSGAGLGFIFVFLPGVMIVALVFGGRVVEYFGGAERYLRNLLYW